jgi:DNA-binding NarL/FixJ family response regulator
MPDLKYIAIVDDHTMFRKGLVMLIDLFHSYKVMLDVANGKELIDRFNGAERLPDIVLLDIQMPEMDGYATAEWLRVNHPDIKVLALSTMDSDATIIKMIRHGARGFILKDAEPKELQLAFDEVIQKGYFYNDMLTRKVLQSLHRITADGSSMNIFVSLTERELEFIKHACSEKSYAEIASEMFLSERTIDGYRDALFRKLQVGTRVGLVIYAIKNNIVKL